MTTHEAEITSPISVTSVDGRTLVSGAYGWSRQPYQSVELSGPWGRRKRWDYWSIQAGDLIVSGVVADIDYLGTSDIWWTDLEAGDHGGRAVFRIGGRGFELPARFGQCPVRVTGKKYRCSLDYDADGSLHLHVVWVESTGEQGELRAEITMPERDESLNVVIPWSDSVFQYTSKHQARPVVGAMTVGDRQWTFGREAWGILDIGRGRWPYATRWNWGGGFGFSEGGKRIGVQVGGKWTAGTGYTENGIFIDGRLSKIGRELIWTYDWDNPMRPWSVRDPEGQIDLVLTPRFDKHSRLNLGLLRRETHQVFGRWTGLVVDDAGNRHELRAIQGFAEECRARW